MSSYSCNYCNKSCPGRLKRCGRCKFAAYCNIDCQKNHWPKHKPDCHFIKKRNTPTTIPDIRTTMVSVSRFSELLTRDLPLADGSTITIHSGDRLPMQLLPKNTIIFIPAHEYLAMKFNFFAETTVGGWLFAYHSITDIDIYTINGRLARICKSVRRSVKRVDMMMEGISQQNPYAQDAMSDFVNDVLILLIIGHYLTVYPRDNRTMSSFSKKDLAFILYNSMLPRTIALLDNPNSVPFSGFSESVQPMTNALLDNLNSVPVFARSYSDGSVTDHLKLFMTLI